MNGQTIHYKISPYRARNSLAYYKRKIVDAFKTIGIEPPYLDIVFGGGMGLYSEDGWAEVTWTIDGKDHSYKCDSQPRAVDNVAAISQIIEADCKAIRRGLKTFGQVMNQFRIGYDADAPRTKSPREILGIPAHINDLDYVKFKYKQKAKELHPDQGGDPEQFKELQEAYGVLKKELED